MGNVTWLGATAQAVVGMKDPLTQASLSLPLPPNAHLAPWKTPAPADHLFKGMSWSCSLSTPDFCMANQPTVLFSAGSGCSTANNSLLGFTVIHSGGCCSLFGSEGSPHPNAHSGHFPGCWVSSFAEILHTSQSAPLTFEWELGHLISELRRGCQRLPQWLWYWRLCGVSVRNRKPGFEFQLFENNEMNR